MIRTSKFYTADLKYAGGDDSFEYKLSIFYEMCHLVELPGSMLYRAFPIMLKGNALSFYHSNIGNLPPTFDLLCDLMRGNFETDEF